MNVRRSLRSRGEVISAVVPSLLALAVVVLPVGSEFPALHSILNTAVFLLSAMLAFLLWDMGWHGSTAGAARGRVLRGGGILELLHVFTALDFSDAPQFAMLLRLWGQRLVASGEVPPGVSVVMSKPPKLAELRQWPAEFGGEREAGS